NISILYNVYNFSFLGSIENISFVISNFLFFFCFVFCCFGCVGFLLVEIFGNGRFFQSLVHKVPVFSASIIIEVNAFSISNTLITNYLNYYLFYLDHFLLMRMHVLHNLVMKVANLCLKMMVILLFLMFVVFVG